MLLFISLNDRFAESYVNSMRKNFCEYLFFILSYINTENQIDMKYFCFYSLQINFHDSRWDFILCLVLNNIS